MLQVYSNTLQLAPSFFALTTSLMGASFERPISLQSKQENTILQTEIAIIQTNITASPGIS